MSIAFLPIPLQPRPTPPTGAASTSSNSKGKDGEVDHHSEVLYEPLAISEEGEQNNSGTQGESSEMGFKDEYQRPERRSGDAIAQLAAIVRFTCSALD